MKSILFYVFCGTFVRLVGMIVVQGAILKFYQAFLKYSINFSKIRVQSLVDLIFLADIKRSKEEGIV